MRNFLFCAVSTHFMHLVSFSFTAWKVSVLRVFLVRIFPHLEWIRIWIASLRIWSKCGKMETRKTPNTDTFHQVILPPNKGSRKIPIYVDRVSVLITLNKCFRGGFKPIKKSFFAKMVDGFYFFKNLHLRCLARLEIRLCVWPRGCL